MPDKTELLSQLTGHWYNFLKKESVKFPTAETRLNQLLCLLDYYPKPVSQDMMDQWIRQKGGKNDRQARHLAWDGWYIQTGNVNTTRMEVNSNLASGELCLVSFKKPNPVWQKFNEIQLSKELKYPGFLSSIRKHKKRGCFMCGRKSIEIHPFANISHSEIDLKFAPLCEMCKDWCEKHKFSIQIDENLVARPLIPEA
jgi:hypothetical protein